MPKKYEKCSNRNQISLGFGYRANSHWAIEFDFTLQGSKTGQDQEFNSYDRLVQFKLRGYLSDIPFSTMKQDDFADQCET